MKRLCCLFFVVFFVFFSSISFAGEISNKLSKESVIEKIQKKKGDFSDFMAAAR